MPLVKPRPSRSPYPYMIAGAMFLVVAIFAIANWQEDRRKYEYRGGPIGDLSRVHEPYYQPERQVAVKSKRVPVSGTKGPDPDFWSEDQLLEVINSPVVKVLSRPMYFNDCLGMIRHLTKTTGPPVTLINTEDAQVSQWPVSVGGYFVVSCSRINQEITVAKSFKVGDWISIP